jgi:glycosyltransferase involved in cell wall biosynthesis
VHQKHLSGGSRATADRSRRILIVATVAGHLRAFHLAWVDWLRHRGFNVAGVARDVTGCRDCKEHFNCVYNVPFSRSGFFSRQPLIAGQLLRQVVNEWNPALVHFHTPNAAFFGRHALARIRRERGINVLYTAHGFHFFAGGRFYRNVLFRAAEASASRHTDAIITMNDEDFRAAQRFIRNGSPRIWLVPGVGIDLDRFARDRVGVDEIWRLRKEIGLTGTERCVLMVAEFIKRKRHCDAIKAMTLVRDPNAILLLVGQGIEEKRIRCDIEMRGIANRVRCLGFRNDVAQLMRLSEVVILPSEQEGLPLAVIEAMAMERAVIGANTRGTRDLLSDGGGIIHEVGDSAALASGIDRILAHPAEADRLGKQGRRSVVQKYSWPIVRAMLMEVYSHYLPSFALRNVLDCGNGLGSTELTKISNENALRWRD